MNLADLPKPDYKRRLDHGDALNKDIIRTIEKNYPRAVKQTQKFAQQFKGRNRTETAHNVWNFLKNHIDYEKDSEDEQIIKLPSRFINDATGDCKSYSLTAASLLSNIGIPVAFRYASYRDSRTPTHVYVVAKDERGKDIIVDGVWKEFNTEKKPTYKFTHPMKVYTMSGTDGIGFSFHHLSREIKKDANKVAAGVKKIALAPARLAFNGLMEVNSFGLAGKLNRAIKKNPNKVKSKWESLGGNFHDLQKVIASGSKHKPLLGINDCIEGIGDNRLTLLEQLTEARENNDDEKVDRIVQTVERHYQTCRNMGVPKRMAIRASCTGLGIGLAPLAAAAAAAPIIAAISPLLKDLGVGDEETDPDTGDPIPGTGVDDMLQSTANSVNQVATNPLVKQLFGDPTNMADPTSPQHAHKFDTGARQGGGMPKTGVGFKLSPKVILIGAGVAGVLFLGYEVLHKQAS